ncbi:hypothetical protein MIND_00411500 [Mycena indigotica]|uniref:Uncharacterized protein n=1 Tax=Mycena indigotica TaxID=2126181 RepID=A0A8H6SW44_9AGAR|nr:uncharacterized protein MIND_00411500 [Mycena indigotica]KAF7306210.1 hypothetical protein MIND_00411500 [Mycena indigotica]
MQSVVTFGASFCRFLLRMNDDEAAFLQRSRKLMAGLDDTLEALGDPGPAIAVLADEDSDPEVEMKSESDEDAKEVLLDPSPLRHRRSREDERKSKEVWFHEYRKMESSLRKALATVTTVAKEKQRAEKKADNALKEVGVLERETKDLKGQLETMDQQMSELRTGPSTTSEALATLRAKYDKVKEQRKEQRKTVAEWDAYATDLQGQIATLKEKKESMQETVRDLKAEVELLRKENKDLGAVQVEKKERSQKQNDQETVVLIAAYEYQVARAAESAVSRCQTRLMSLSSGRSSTVKHTNLPPSYNICQASENLFAFLARDATTQSFMNHVLFLPNRTVSCASVGYLAFAPTVVYDGARKEWKEGSDLGPLVHSTRELFITVQRAGQGGYITYAGTFLCHQLVYPRATRPHKSIDTKALMDIAFGTPSCVSAEEADRLVRAKFPAGFIDVEVVGLQLVGFNTALYNALKARHGVVLVTGGQQQPPPVVPAKRPAAVMAGGAASKEGEKGGRGGKPAWKRVKTT